MSHSASFTAKLIRNLRLNKHVDIMFLGDPIKSILMPMWARVTQLPGVHQTTYTFPDDHVVCCNIWDLSVNDPICRMFPLDGTEDTGFDYCIIVYDAITRTKSENLEQWISVKDQICSQQHPNRECAVIVIVMKTLRTKEETYKHIVDQCEKQKIPVFPTDNTKQGLSKISNLPKEFAKIVFNKRKNHWLSKVQSILNESSSVKNG